MSKFYVKSVTARDKIIAYGIYDKVNGIVSEHDYFPVKYDAKDAHDAAIRKCRKMNGASK